VTLQKWAWDTIVDTSAEFTEAWDQHREAIAAHLQARTDIDPHDPAACARALYEAFVAVVGSPPTRRPARTRTAKQTPL
jgi:hypothetical protein